MTPRRLFVDTAYVQALLNPIDQHHSQAVSLDDRFGETVEYVTTEAVLIEIANGFSSLNRLAAMAFIDGMYESANSRILSVDVNLFKRARQLYRDRVDKQWGMTDCISFIVMSDYQITEAITADHHFEQAGFTILMK